MAGVVVVAVVDVLFETTTWGESAEVDDDEEVEVEEVEVAGILVEEESHMDKFNRLEYWSHWLVPVAGSKCGDWGLDLGWRARVR